MADPFDLVRRFGIRVIPVSEELPAPVMFARDRQIAFLSSGLDGAAQREVADYLLSTALWEAAPRR